MTDQRFQLSPEIVAWHTWLTTNAPTFLDRFAAALQSGDRHVLNKLQNERRALQDRYLAQQGGTAA